MLETTDLQTINLPEQVQHLNSRCDGCLLNWIALRASFEFDVKKGQFRYRSKEFQRANKLVYASLAEFINDIPSRFLEVFRASPTRTAVSSLTALCNKMAERTGASASWLVRELISRYIANGAIVENSGGPDQHDAYGKMEHHFAEENRQEQAAHKAVVLVFDSKVSIKDVLYAVDQDGSVWLSASRYSQSNNLVQFNAQDPKEDAFDSLTAVESGSHGSNKSIEVVAIGKGEGGITFDESRAIETDLLV